MTGVVTSRTLTKAAIFAVFGASVALVGCPKPPVEAVPEHWCPEGFEPGHGDLCFALPVEHGPHTATVVYLHGMMQGHGSADEWAAARSAVAHGFAVVLPRGHRGLCAWKPELKDHFCWPQDPSDQAEMKSVVSDWDRTLWQVNELLEGGTHPRYVLAFSNGAFFAAHLARTGLFKADAYALVGGGAPFEEPASGDAHPPMLLLTAEKDDAQGPKVKELHEQLTREKWPNLRCTRPGEHPLTGEDVDAALRFFRHEPAGGSFTCEGQAPAAPAPDPKPADKTHAKKK